MRGGNAFEEVYLAREDWELVKHHCSLTMKRSYAELVMKDQAGELSESDYIPLREKTYHDLTDGMEFGLGDITVLAIRVKGHTQGMTCMLIKEARAILFGDACNAGTFLFAEEASSVEEYRESLLALKEWEGMYDTVYFSHGPGEGPKSTLDDCVECCDLILAGEADNEVFEFMGEENYRARETVNGIRQDGKIGNLIYSKEKVLRNKEARRPCC